MAVFTINKSTLYLRYNC